jgi:hypothetical protein
MMVQASIGKAGFIDAGEGKISSIIVVTPDLIRGP